LVELLTSKNSFLHSQFLYRHWLIILHKIKFFADWSVDKQRPCLSTIFNPDAMVFFRRPEDD
jgi:hypothetical protein